MHAGNGPMDDLGRRLVEASAAAADDVLVHPPVDCEVPPGQAMPRWSWDGPQA